MTDPVKAAQTALDVGVPIPRDLLQALLDELVARRASVTTGGPGKPTDDTWGNQALPAPPSASGDTAPPLVTDRGSRRHRHFADGTD